MKMRLLTALTLPLVFTASASAQVLLSIDDLQQVPPALRVVTPMTGAQDPGQDGFGATPSPTIEGAVGALPGTTIVAMHVWFFDGFDISNRPIWNKAGTGLRRNFMVLPAGSILPGLAIQHLSLIHI